jgi:hypothetical protein
MRTRLSPQAARIPLGGIACAESSGGATPISSSRVKTGLVVRELLLSGRAESRRLGNPAVGATFVGDVVVVSRHRR